MLFPKHGFHPAAVRPLSKSNRLEDYRPGHHWKNGGSQLSMNPTPEEEKADSPFGMTFFLADRDSRNIVVHHAINPRAFLAITLTHKMIMISY